MSNYLLLLESINNLIIEKILNKYDPIVKIINSTILTSIRDMEKINTAKWKN